MKAWCFYSQQAKVKSLIKFEERMGGDTTAVAAAQEDTDILIVGAGICGLATALALHRKGIKSVVLERSKGLRASGAGIGLLSNGWRALDALGVAPKLRQSALSLQSVQDIWLDSGKKKVGPLSIGETRCVKRSDLIQALAEELPNGTIRFGCQVLSINFDPLTSSSIVKLHDGSRLKAKVLIGCDGANSVVADFLELKPKKLFYSSSIRAFTYYPNGHGFRSEFVRIRKGNVLSGRAPVTDKLVFWFLLQNRFAKDSKFPEDAELVKTVALETSKGFSTEWTHMIENCDLSSLSLTRLRYRAPWEILLGTFRRGTVTVAGDAMHVMGPFLGQGGSAAMEDAVVLARCLAPKMKEINHDLHQSVKQIEETLDAYIKERRMRLLGLSAQTYLTGSMFDTSSSLVRFVIICLILVLFGNPVRHTKYDCGGL